ncbi:MAG: hypothetical protein M3066_11620, partial [Actinomycetota bacterium]|nr:hypothetical protein [Actinomycetota bacterium]
QQKEMGVEELGPRIANGDSAAVGTTADPAPLSATLAGAHPTAAPSTIATPTIETPTIETPTIETSPPPPPAPPTLDLPPPASPAPTADMTPTVDTTPTIDPPPAPTIDPPPPAPPTRPIDTPPPAPQPVPAVDPPPVSAAKKHRWAWLAAAAAAVVVVVGVGTAIAMRGGSDSTGTAAATVAKNTVPATAPATSTTTVAVAPIAANPVVHFSVVDKVLPDDKADDVELTIDNGPTVRFAGSPDGGLQPQPLTVTGAGKHHYKLTVVTTTKAGTKSTVTGSGNLDVHEGRQFDVATVENEPGFVCLALENKCQD